MKYSERTGNLLHSLGLVPWFQSFRPIINLCEEKKPNTTKTNKTPTLNISGEEGRENSILKKTQTKPHTHYRGMSF